MYCILHWFFYLFSGDFRGTKDSLKKLVSEDRYRKPLLRDIWYFYGAERLYLLQVRNSCSPFQVQLAKLSYANVLFQLYWFQTLFLTILTHALKPLYPFVLPLVDPRTMSKVKIGSLS